MPELRCFVFVLLLGVIQDSADSCSKVRHNFLCALTLELLDYWYELIKNVHFNSNAAVLSSEDVWYGKGKFFCCLDVVPKCLNKNGDLFDGVLFMIGVRHKQRVLCVLVESCS